LAWNTATGRAGRRKGHLLSAAAIWCAFAGSAWAVEPRPAPLAGEVVTVAGDETLRFDAETNWRIAEATQGLKAGDALKTGPNGALALRFADQTMVRMPRNSELTVKAIPLGGTAELELTSGRIWARAATGGTGVDVVTPAATAAIRGTDWSLEILPDGRTQLTVMAGVVELKNAYGSVKVGPGEAAVAAIDKAPAKIFLTQAPGREQFLYAVAARDVFVSMRPIVGMVDGATGKTVRARRAAIAAVPESERSAAERTDWAEIALAFDGRDAATAAIAAARRGDLDAEQEARLGVVEALIAGQRKQWPETEAKLNAAIPALDGERRYMAEFALAIALTLDHQPDRARSLLAGLQARPETATSAEANAWLLALAGDLDGAYAAITAGAAAFPQNVDLALLASQIAILRSDEAGARQWLQQAVALDPENPETLRVRAVVESDYDWNSHGAVRTLEQAVEIAPGYSDLWNHLGLARSDDGDPVGAEQAYRRAIALDPEDPVPHANYAILLLDNSRVEAGDAEADRALALDPSFWAALLAKGRVELQRGDLPAAKEHFLNAVAANPLVSDSTVGLAIEYYEDGELKRAQQSLDAAERLDPEDPIVPLVKTVIALDQAEADEAIINARKAYQRFKKHGGIYNPLAATQAGGSYMSSAFEELGLRDWSRFYGDQLFSPFDSGSQFYKAIALREPVAVNQTIPTGSLSQASLTQGLLLEPLAVSARNRYTDLFRRPFLDVDLGGDVTFNDSGAVGWSSEAVAQGYINGPIPLAGYLNYARSGADADAPASLSDLEGGNLFLGAQPTLADRLLAWGQYSRFHDRLPNGALADNEDAKQKGTSYQTGLGYGHSFGTRNDLNMVVAYQQNNVGAEDVTDLGAGVELGNRARNKDDAVFAALSYKVDLGGPVLWTGVEGQSIDRDGASQQELALGGGTLAKATTHSGANPLLGNVYADLAVPLGKRWNLEGGFTIAHVEDGVDLNTTRFQPRAGIAFTPADGQWLRLAYREDSNSAFLTSLAPVGVVGLVQSDTPLDFGGETRSVIARWDAEWNDRIFTFVEYEHQEIKRFEVSFNDSLSSVGADEGRIDRVSFGANAWLGGGFGVFGRASFFDSEVTDGPGEGQRLPTVPDWLANAGITWEHPSQVTLSLTETVIGERRGGIGTGELSTAPITSFTAEWQPLEKHIDFTFQAINLFDEHFDFASGVPAPGRTVLVGATIRF